MNAAYYAIGAASSLKDYDRVISLYNRFRFLLLSTPRISISGLSLLTLR